MIAAGAGPRAKATGNFQTNFDHPQRPLGLIVGERNLKFTEEGQDAVVVGLEAGEGDSPSKSPKSRKAMSSPEGLRCSSTTKDQAFLFLCYPESGITPVLPVWHFISEVERPRFRVRGGRNGKKQIG